MNILITTGIFAPESGGPATYTPRIARKLTEAGHTVTVITYSDAKEYPEDGEYPFRLIRVVRTGGRAGKVLNYLRFFKRVLQYSKEADFIYTLDWLAAGLPVALASKLRKKKYVVRVGGGYIWEKYLSKGNEPMPLKEFYALELHKRYKFLFFLIRFVLRNAAHVAFNSIEQARLFGPWYGLYKKRVSVIENPVPEVAPGAERTEATKEIVFAGRLVAMKNVDALLLAFKRAQLQGYTLTIIGDGPEKEHIQDFIQKLAIQNLVTMEDGMPQGALYERIRNCAFAVIPSWTDISPNQAYELLAHDIPFIITTENYLSIREQFPVMFEPGSVQELVEVLKKVTTPSGYTTLVGGLRKIRHTRTWDDALEDHLAIFETL